MFGKRFGLLSAELFLMRMRVSTWVLLGIWGTLGFFFSYVLPYFSYRGATGPEAPGAGTDLAALLPESMVETMIGGFPFYGGAIVLILGVLTIGSEFGWGTLKTLFTQRPGRGQIFAAKMGALAIMLVPFVLIIFSIGAVSSVTIALIEDATIVWPSVQELIEAWLAGWLILAVWAAAGVLLAVITRGTSLAIGIGIIYSLVIEGLVSAFANQIELLEPIVKGFLRANAYSLVRPLGGADEAAGDGPGLFTGPFVSGTQALVVLVVYLVVFLGVSVWLLRHRDVA